MAHIWQRQPLLWQSNILLRQCGVHSCRRRIASPSITQTPATPTVPEAFCRICLLIYGVNSLVVTWHIIAWAVAGSSSLACGATEVVAQGKYASARYAIDFRRTHVGGIIVGSCACRVPCCGLSNTVEHDTRIGSPAGSAYLSVRMTQSTMHIASSCATCVCHIC